MEEKKTKLLFLADHPLTPSGIGTQSNYLIRGLLDTGRYEVYSVAGAIKHADYNIRSVPGYESTWKVHPVDGYGDKETMRRLLREQKPDAVFFFTDPRFWDWLFSMEDEVRQVAPMLYWHVWDNDPLPNFNMPFYRSCDFIGALSLKTYGLLQGLGFDRSRFSYIPHAVPSQVFRPVDEAEVQEYKRKNFGPHASRKFIVFWSNRNARRKRPGDVIAIFSKFAEKVGKENVALMLNTDAQDPTADGLDLVKVARQFDVESNIIICDRRVPVEEMNMFYNVTDVTMNIAQAEGFGLGTLECMMAGNPILVNMTGGLQFQVGDWWKDLTDFSDQDLLYDRAHEARRRARKDPGANWFGEAVFPAARQVSGGLMQVPFIHDDHVSHDDAVKALVSLYEMGRARRREVGLRASKWARETFDLKKTVSDWDRIIQEQVAMHRSGPRPTFRTSVI